MRPSSALPRVRRTPPQPAPAPRSARKARPTSAPPSRLTRPTAASRRRSLVPRRPRVAPETPEAAEPALPPALVAPPPAVAAAALPPARPHSARPLGEFTRGSLLGKGGFARVWTGMHTPTGREVAIKSYDRKRVQRDPKLRRLLLQETRVLARLSHPNVLRLYQVIKTPQAVHLVTELVRGGSLRSLVRRRGKLGEGFSRALFAQLVGAVAYLHANGVIHRDIKLENVLLKGGTEVKLVDFGFSAQQKNVDDPPKAYRLSCGTPLYMAPELICKQPYGSPVDAWALGVLLYCMVFGGWPFSAGNTTDLARIVRKGVFALPPHTSAGLRDLLQGLLCVDPERRLTVEEVGAHPWLSAGSTLPVRAACPPVRREADIDAAVLEQVVEAGYDRGAVVAGLLRGVRGAETVAYHLLSS